MHRNDLHTILTQEYADRRPYRRQYNVLSLGCSSFQPDTAYICDYGWVKIEDGHVSYTTSGLINWFDFLEAQGNSLESDSLRARLQKLSEQMAPRVLQYTPDAMLADGIAPNAALGMLRSLLEDAANEDELVVSNNMVKFDGPVLIKNWERVYLETAPIDCATYDTGAFERALQLDMPPWSGEDYAAWCLRSGGSRGVKWSIPSWADDKYNLSQIAKDNFGQYFTETRPGALREAMLAAVLYELQALPALATQP